MARTINYVLVNDTIKFPPITFEREVNTQQDIIDLKAPLEVMYNVAELNKEILLHNSDPFNTKKATYQILFSIAQPFDGRLTP